MSCTDRGQLNDQRGVLLAVHTTLDPREDDRVLRRHRCLYNQYSSTHGWTADSDTAITISSSDLGLSQACAGRHGPGDWDKAMNRAGSKDESG